MPSSNERALKIHVKHQKYGVVLNRRIRYGDPVILNQYPGRNVTVVPHPEWPGRLEPLVASMGAYLVVPCDGWCGSITTGSGARRRIIRIPFTGHIRQRMTVPPDAVVSIVWGKFLCMLQRVRMPMRRAAWREPKTVNFRGK